VLSFNPNITWEIVQANSDKEWDYEYMSTNPNITWDIIEFNPYLEWNNTVLSHNPQIKSREKKMKGLSHIRMLSKIFNMVKN
jgi:hypothetical protein